MPTDSRPAPATRCRPEQPLASVYDAAYAGVPNWDVGHPQRPFVRLVEAGVLDGPVLDVGCGTGELALFLAARGFDVLGVDLSPVAVQQARQKARYRRVPASFLVWDALDLPAIAAAGFSFRTVLDSAMFHVLGDRERDQFVAGLADVLAPGGVYCVLGDARRDPRDVYGITPAELRERFTATGDWAVVLSEETTVQRRWGATPAYFVCLRRQ
ncbi:class I SAM-dependent methyltransferase [Halobacterium sp. CBA1126]|uniref:class I SAM-dependent methyltransferase n=1 Tax=Halobacterium sp. CBA1126 TaxID=2668074 RepID=UPI0013293EE1|nr:methyltransferase domain-containing protein [Halobacterium sp. CBA1126]